MASRKSRGPDSKEIKVSVHEVITRCNFSDGTGQTTDAYSHVKKMTTDAGSSNQERTNYNYLVLLPSERKKVKKRKQDAVADLEMR